MATTSPTASAPAAILAPTWRDRLRTNRTTAGVLAASIFVYLASLIAVPQFATTGHLSDSLLLAGFLGIVAVGQGIVILGSGIDLSVANVMSGAGILLSTLAAAGLPTWLVLAVTLAGGAALGLVNGVGVTRFDIPPLVMTLSTGSIVQGMTLVTTNGTPQSGVPAGVQRLANADVAGGLTGTVFVWFALTAMAVFLLTATRTGRYLFVIGTNRRVAELSGVPVARVTTVTYVISGFTAAVGGCLLVGYTGISSVTMGDAYMLPAIAAVVLGGTSILGGRGGAVGMALGAFLLTVVQSLLTVVKVPESGRQMLEGLILLAVVILYNVRGRGVRDD